MKRKRIPLQKEQRKKRKVETDNEFLGFEKGLYLSDIIDTNLYDLLTTEEIVNFESDRKKKYEKVGEYIKEIKEKLKEDLKNVKIKPKSRVEKIQNKPERKIITSLHLEDDFILSKVKIPKPWYVGLVTNLAVMYGNDYKKLKIKKRVKCRTVLYISCWSMKKVQEKFNNKETVPCSTLKAYCGYLTVLFCLTGFKSLKQAKFAFINWKVKTRNAFSRLVCGQVLYEKMKDDNPELCYYATNMSPEENLKRIRKKKI